MASSIQAGYAWLQDGATVNGLMGRTALVAASFFNIGGAQVRGGVMPSGGAMKVSAGSGMSINVAAGYAVCASSAGSSNGGYLFGLMSAANLTVAGSDAANPRVDLVCANVVDPGTSEGFAEVQIIAGTPSAGANLSNFDGAPSLPGNATTLAYVLVPADSTSVSSANILDQRGVTVAQGGILPTALEFAPAGYDGMLIFDYTSGTFKHNAASGPHQAQLLPFTPQQARVSATVGALSGSVTIASVTVTVDGNTDIEAIAKWPNVSMSSGGNYSAAMSIVVDGAETLAEISVNGNTSGPEGDGGTLHHVTQSGADRLSAGSHTISFKAFFAGDGVHEVEIAAAGGSPATLYVRPAPL